jgi:hypothetical protein
LSVYLDPITEKKTKNDHHVHILPPVTLRVKVTFDDTLVGGNGPKIEDSEETAIIGLDVGLPSLGITVSKSQYCNIINLTSFMSNFSLRFENRQHRPKDSVHMNPKAWWRYAINSIRDDVRKKLERTSWKTMFNKHMLHKKYMKNWKCKDSDYCKKLKLKQFKPEKNKKDMELLIMMEDQLTINDIMDYREKAEKDVEKMKLEWKNKKNTLAKKNSSGFFGGWFGGNNKDKNENKKKKKKRSRCRPVQIFQENERIIRNRMKTNAIVHRVATVESTLSQMNDANSISSCHNNNGPIPGGGEGPEGTLSNGSIFIQSNGRSMQCS